jgi:hypothetical protein
MDSDVAKQFLRDAGIVLLGIAGGWLTRRWRTPFEKRVEKLDLVSRLSKELHMTNDELLEAFADIRKAKKLYALLIGYLINTLEYMKRNNLDRLPLPKELDTDPELVKFFRSKKEVE